MTFGETGAAVQGRSWRLFSLTHRLIEPKLSSALQEGLHLSLMEFTLLDLLDNQQEVGSRMHDVAAAMSMSQTATSRLVSRLEDRGAVVRSFSSDDRRGISTQLSPDGRELLARARPIYEAALEQALVEASDVPGLRPIVEFLRSS